MTDIAELKELAEAEDPHAMWSLAEAYRCGWGVEKDPDKAQELLEKRIPILVELAEKNDRKAMKALEIAFKHGWGVDPDLGKAKEWHKKYWRSI